MSPNLQTFLTMLNNSQPIVQSQFELRMSRWGRTVYFAKNVTIPELTTNTQELNHAGFTIPIACNPKYGSTEINFTIIADKEGYHYYDWRNMVLQSSHPLVAGDTKSTIGNVIQPDNTLATPTPVDQEDTLDIRLRNSPFDETHHHWLVHNFRPITIGSIELSHDSSSFVEFEVTGTFTHITYDCGTHQNAMPKPIENDNNHQENDVKEETSPSGNDVD